LTMNHTLPAQLMSSCNAWVKGWSTYRLFAQFFALLIRFSKLIEQTPKSEKKAMNIKIYQELSEDNKKIKYLTS